MFTNLCCGYLIMPHFSSATPPTEAWLGLCTGVCSALDVLLSYRVVRNGWSGVGKGIGIFQSVLIIRFKCYLSKCIFFPPLAAAQTNLWQVPWQMTFGKCRTGTKYKNGQIAQMMDTKLNERRITVSIKCLWRVPLSWRRQCQKINKIKSIKKLNWGRSEALIRLWLGCCWAGDYFHEFQ